ncbi:MAG: biotin--[acetyl-CoA-carboxylase] ligase [Gemmatimonadales bacterium]|nr:biotin--[acetyl-CoA-carboxylase] ligase [Gemmatimonadales bacterium]
MHRYGTVSSTMTLLHRLAAEGAGEGTAVVAEEQLAGRGSRGCAWHSPRGGLWLSLLLRPAAGTELLSLRVGLAAVETLQHLGPGLRLGLKWPNDLMLDDRKLGGILCEARWTGDAPAWVAIGVGINVRNPIPPDLSSVAIALADPLPALTPDAVLDALLPRLRALDASSSRLHDAELDRLALRDWLRGRRLAQPVEGYADGIGPEGALRVRRDDGTIAELRAGRLELAERSRSS